MSSLKLRNLGVLHQGHLYKATSPFLLMTEFFFFFFFRTLGKNDDRTKGAIPTLNSQARFSSPIKEKASLVQLFNNMVSHSWDYAFQQNPR